MNTLDQMFEQLNKSNKAQYSYEQKDGKYSMIIYHWNSIELKWDSTQSRYVDELTLIGMIQRRLG